MVPVSENVMRLVEDLPQTAGMLRGVFYDVEAGRWQTLVPCALCGGWLLALRTTERYRAPAAHLEARVMRAALDASDCLACRADAWRRHPPREQTNPFCWYDPRCCEWLGWQPLAEADGGGVVVPLGVRLLSSQDEAVVALSALTGNLPLSLQVCEEGVPTERDLPALYYDGDRQQFMLWMPCVSCGGAALPLSVRNGMAVRAAGVRAMMVLSWLSEHGCAGCNAREKRADAAAELETVDGLFWFDPLCADYVIACPFGDGAVTLPLGLEAIDVPVGSILRACATVMGHELT